MTQAIATPGAAAAGRTARTTRALLAAGAAAGPVFVVIVLAQAFTRPGFDVRRYPPSLLSLGDGGWVQIANFVVVGLLFAASALGARRALRGGPAGTWGPPLLGAFGLLQAAGGVFLADAGDGFPPGTPPGPPAHLSWHGALHLTVFALGMLSLIALAVVVARRSWVVGQRDWAAASAATAAVIVVCVPLAMSGTATVALYAAVVVGWAWSSATAARLACGTAPSGGR
jgi:hypothetical protein